MKPPRYFLLRLRRGGPIVPARLAWCDHEPGEPANKLDRGRLSIYPIADIAGEEVDPGIVLDRIGVRRRGDSGLLPVEILAALAAPGRLMPRPVGHWAYAQPVSEPVYRYHVKRLRWAERNAPDDPALTPRRRIDPAQLPLPDFDRENAALL